MQRWELNKLTILIEVSFEGERSIRAMAITGQVVAMPGRKALKNKQGE